MRRESLRVVKHVTPTTARQLDSSCSMPSTDVHNPCVPCAACSAPHGATCAARFQHGVLSRPYASKRESITKRAAMRHVTERQRTETQVKDHKRDPKRVCVWGGGRGSRVPPRISICRRRSRSAHGSRGWPPRHSILDDRHAQICNCPDSSTYVDRSSPMSN